MQVFDLILFKGNDFVGRSLRQLQRAKLGPDADFSHVGLYIDSTVDSRLEPGVQYILESTCSGPLADGVKNIHDESFLGVQIRRLDWVGAACNGSVYYSAMCQKWRKENVMVTQTDSQIYQHVIQSVEGIPYDANAISLLSALLPCIRCARLGCEKTMHTQKWLFCSEMAAFVLKKCGILPASVNESNVLPSDFLPNVQDDDKQNLPKIYDQPKQLLFSKPVEHVSEPK